MVGCASTQTPIYLHNPLNHQRIIETGKILLIVGKEITNALHLHRSDDIGIMNLLTADLVIPHQHDELPSHGGSIVFDWKAFQELRDLFEDGSLWQTLKDLGPGQGAQILTDDLPTNPIAQLLILVIVT